MKYDFLIVGAGLTGATIARLLLNAGKKVLVIDKRDHVAGNCHTPHENGLIFHQYGPHAFHTNSIKVWEFVQKYSKFNNYRILGHAMIGNDIFSFPINAMTFHQVFGLVGPRQIQGYLKTVASSTPDLRNFETYCISTMGQKLYEMFFFGYTKKMWGREPCTLPASIAQRIPLRTNFNSLYHDALYAGVPIYGYTSIVKNLLRGAEVRLGVDFFQDRDKLYWSSHRLVYTGAIDEFFDYRFGPLPYRTISFYRLDLESSMQGCSSMNYPSLSIPYTRTIEHSHFDSTHKHTKDILTFETAKEYDGSAGRDRYYPIPEQSAQDLYNKYLTLHDEKYPEIEIAGRLGRYQYLDMDQAIASAIVVAEKLLK